MKRTSLHFLSFFIKQQTRKRPLFSQFFSQNKSQMITMNMITTYVTLRLLGEYVYCINYHKSFCGNYLLIELDKLNNVIDRSME